MLTMRVLSLSAVLGALACTTADILMLDTSLRPQTSPQSIRLIAQEPARPFAVVAIVSARGDIISARQRLIKEAARLGGHAVLLDNGSLTRIGGDEGTEQQITGKVIVFTDSSGAN
jgi:hypothetical protein